MSIRDILREFNISTSSYYLYEQAFSHSSYAHEHGDKHDYERIDFMGDAVLDLVVADLVFKNHPNMPQGDMSKLRSKLVKKESLANYARKYNFGEAILLGNGEKQNGGKNLDKILEDVCEAFIGAIYLDLGYDMTYSIIKKIFLDDVINYSSDELTDYKSKLQEYVQADTRDSVKYRLVCEKGNAQSKEFIMEVLWDGNVWGRGSGSSKKKAEQQAAKDALSKVAK